MIVSGSEAKTKRERILMLEADRGPSPSILLGSEAITKGQRISMLKPVRGPSPSDDFTW